jgi:ribose transport system substrate-binding protein
MSSSKIVLGVVAAAAIGAAAYYRNQVINAGNGAEPTKPVRIAFVVGGPDAFWDRVVVGAKAAAEEFDADLQLVVPVSSSEQTTELVKIDASSIDGLAISPLEPQQQNRLLSTLATKTNVVTYDNDAPDSLRHVYVGANNRSAGRMCAELIKQALPEGGKVVIFVGDNERLNAVDRRLGLINALRGTAEETSAEAQPLDQPIEADGYTILATYLDGSDPHKARENAAQALQEHEDLECMVGLYGYNGPECLQALQAADKTGEVKVVAFDEHDATLAGIEAGSVVGTVVQDPYLYGYESVRILCNLARGNRASIPLPGSGHWALQCAKVTEDNLEEYRTQLAHRGAKPADKHGD